jgi:hypothetical protein
MELLRSFRAFGDQSHNQKEDTMSLSLHLHCATAIMMICTTTAASAQPFCLDPRNIRDSRAVDTHTVMFRMIDGSRYRAALAQDCPGLNFNGFSIFPANSDRVCAGLQLIRTFKDHQVCRIATIAPVGHVTMQ